MLWSKPNIYCCKFKRCIKKQVFFYIFSQLWCCVSDYELCTVSCIILLHATIVRISEFRHSVLWITKWTYSRQNFTRRLQKILCIYLPHCPLLCRQWVAMSHQPCDGWHGLREGRPPPWTPIVTGLQPGLDCLTGQTYKSRKWKHTILILHGKFYLLLL